MPHFKAPDNSLHFLDSAEFAYLLPAGCVEITEDEYDTLANPPESQGQAAVRARAALKAIYQPMLDKLDYMQLGYLSTQDLASAASVETFKAGLRALMKSEFPGCGTYGEMKAQATAQYLVLVHATPAGVVVKFRDLMTDDAT